MVIKLIILYYIEVSDSVNCVIQITGNVLTLILKEDVVSYSLRVKCFHEKNANETYLFITDCLGKNANKIILKIVKVSNNCIM